jgi:hypothetical protein
MDVPSNTTASQHSTMASFSSSSGPAWANPDIPVPQSSQNTGDIGNDMLLEPYSTLEEPVLDTIMRDVRAVHAKLKVVMLPLDRTFAPLGYTGVEQNGAEQSHEQEVIGENQRKVIESLKDWDLWYVGKQRCVLCNIYTHLNTIVGAHSLSV